MLRLISSMATRQLLGELSDLWQKASGVEVMIESVGGVVAATRIRSGEAFDGVVLASDAITGLTADGYVAQDSAVDLVRSGVAVAVRSGAPVPDISTEAGLRNVVEAAPTIGYSTGPSGVALLELFERWGLMASIRPRTVQAPAGVPVGELVARGDVALGFQQLSELINVGGITVVGMLPEPVSINTMFTAAICNQCSDTDRMAEFFRFMASSEAAAVKLRHGMSAA